MYENLIDKSKELVNKIYESMNVIESCNTMADKIKGLPICFLDEEGELIGLEKVLHDSQMASIREGIVATIVKNSKESEEYLAVLTGSKNKPAIINQDFEDAVNEMVEQAKPRKKENIVEVEISRPKPKEDKPELTVTEVRKLLKKGYDVKQLCEYFHCYKKTVIKFLEDNGLVKVKEPLDYNQVKNMYVVKCMNLVDIAEELGYTKDEVYDFIRQNGIRRPSNKDDGFRG